MTGFRRDRVPTSCIPDWASQYEGWDQYQYSPYVDPKVGLHYIMQHNRLTYAVEVLGVFDELIVVRHKTHIRPGRYEEAVNRYFASFFEIPPLGSEVASTADTDAQPE